MAPAVALVPPGPYTPLNQSLLDMGEKRQAQLRTGHAIRDTRPEHRTSLISHIVGDQQTPACEQCSAGLGPFDKCVTVPGHFLGTCANCLYRGRRKECSFRNGKSNPLLSNLFSRYTRDFAACATQQVLYHMA